VVLVFRSVSVALEDRSADSVVGFIILAILKASLCAAVVDFVSSSSRMAWNSLLSSKVGKIIGRMEIIDDV
jgi:hypothetical protein